MTLENAKCVVKVGNNLSEPFDAEQGVRQGDSLSCDFFKIHMDRVICPRFFIKVSCLWPMLMMLTSLAEVNAKSRFAFRVSRSLGKRGVLVKS